MRTGARLRAHAEGTTAGRTGTAACAVRPPSRRLLRAPVTGASQGHGEGDGRLRRHPDQGDTRTRRRPRKETSSCAPTQRRRRPQPERDRRRRASTQFTGTSRRTRQVRTVRRPGMRTYQTTPSSFPPRDVGHTGPPPRPCARDARPRARAPPGRPPRPPAPPPGPPGPPPPPRDMRPGCAPPGPCARDARPRAHGANPVDVCTHGRGAELPPGSATTWSATRRRRACQAASTRSRTSMATANCPSFASAAPRSPSASLKTPPRSDSPGWRSVLAAPGARSRGVRRTDSSPRTPLRRPQDPPGRYTATADLITSHRPIETDHREPRLSTDRSTCLISKWWHGTSSRESPASTPLALRIPAAASSRSR